jgi:2-haloacid dehalogenase/putative hydrolase of the HAD superfamily
VIPITRGDYQVITFDCYGTLIDWESGIAGAFADAAAEDGVTLDRQSVLRAYAEVEPQVEHERYRPYREVLQETASRVAQMLGWRVTYERCVFLPLSLPRWTPFPDTNPALEQLAAAGCRLGILSNVDDDLIAGTRKHFSVPFDLVITAQQVRSYKPAPAHFIAAHERIGNARWLHAAQSNFHDVAPCNALGIPTAWINRHGEKPLAGGVPTHEFRDLAALAQFIRSATTGQPSR